MPLTSEVPRCCKQDFTNSSNNMLPFGQFNRFSPISQQLKRGGRGNNYLELLCHRNLRCNSSISINLHAICTSISINLHAICASIFINLHLSSQTLIEIRGSCCLKHFLQTLHPTFGFLKIKPKSNGGGRDLQISFGTFRLYFVISFDSTDFCSCLNS